VGIRSLGELQDVYHGTVGHNGFLMMDFAPTPDGIISPDQAAMCVQSACSRFGLPCLGLTLLLARLIHTPWVLTSWIASLFWPCSCACQRNPYFVCVSALQWLLHTSMSQPSPLE